MLAISFAALLGVALGRLYRVGALAPGAVLTSLFAALIGAGAGMTAFAITLTAVLAALCLQLGYLVGATIAQTAPRSAASRRSAHQRA